MDRRVTEPEDRPAGDLREQRNRGALVTLLLLCTVMLLVASALPPVLVPPALSQLLAYASLAAVIVAALRRESVFAGHLTRWDQAAALLALSLAAGAFTDPASVGAFLEGAVAELGPAGVPGSESATP